MNNHKNALSNWCGKRYFPLVFVPIAFLFLCLYAKVTSPFFLYDGTDSAIFKTIGLAILKGKVPYADIFDHKGPVLFFINALGQWIAPGRPGIFLLEVINLSLSLFFLFKISKLYSHPAVAFLCTLAVLFFMGACLTEGDQVEEWEMPFLTLALYQGLCFLKNGTAGFSFKTCFIIGGSCAYVLFIRPNDAVAIPGGVMLGMSLYVLLKRQYAVLFRGILSFFLGLLPVALPVFIYFASHHAVGDLINGTFLVNASYAGGFKEQLLSCFGHGKLALAPLLIALVALSARSRGKDAWIILLPVSLLTYLFMGPRLYLHYYMVLVPTICLYLTFLLTDKDRPLILLAAAVLLFSQQAWGESFLKILCGEL